LNRRNPVEYSIPSQPLGSAITSFADQANYRLFVTSDMTEGVNSNGVTGRQQSSAAPSNNPNLQMPAASKPVKVPEIVVKDVEERGYTVDDTSSATRIPVPVHDIPRSSRS
jgi:iron complex outermembrane receptor protein